MASDATLVGQLDELAAVDAFLDAPESGLEGLLLSGRAGMGKTTIWKAALARAQGRGFRVLACRPTEVETRLSFSALVDLFADIADDVLPALPEPQRIALNAALLRSSIDARTAPLAISLGVLGMIRAAAQASPLLIAIDDAPWLDESSARALAFALRRLEDAPVRLLAAQRTEAGATSLPPVLASLPVDRLATVAVTPLTVGETGEVIAATLGTAPRRPTLVRIHEMSGGNPFYALEIARAHERRGGGHGGADLRIPERLDELIRDRIDALPPASVRVALHAAALSPATHHLLGSALGAETVEAGLAPAIRADVLELDDGVIRFTHPLLAAAIYGRASADERRMAHAALARVIHEPEEQARHLALAADAADEPVAAALEQAARTARARGAAAAAGELAEAAVRLTPEDQPADRRRRTMIAADHHAAAGDVPRARTTLEALAVATPEDERATVLVDLGQVLLKLSDRTAAARAFQAALALVGGDLNLRARVEWGLASVAWLTWQDWRDGDQHSAAALRAAEELGDPILLLQVIGHVATWEFSMGRGVRRDLVERAAALELFRNDVPTMEHPDNQMALIRLYLGETAEARRLLERLLAEARRRGEWHALPYLLLRKAWVEIRAGDWMLAQQHAGDCRTTAAQSGQDAPIGYVGRVDVELHALRGNVDEARAAADQALRTAVDMDLPDVPMGLATSLALLELSLGDPAAAYRHLEPALARSFPGQDEPAMLRPTTPLAIEALIGLGRFDEAEARLARYEELARRLDRTVSIADSLHLRALLSAARGDLDVALLAADEAGRLFDSLPLPFEAARARLALGEIRRRARQKGAAREAVGEALATFERLGARRWAERARAELGRTRPRRHAGAELTETEQRVTQLVVDGRTNREIADALFVSVHTVEAHLTRIYRTLGVRSRTELARWAVDAARG